MHEHDFDAVIERLDEEIEWREYELAGLSSQLFEVASDVDDWLCDKDHVRIDEALNGLSSRLDDGTRSILEGLTLLIRIRDDAQPQAEPRSPDPALSLLTRQQLAATPLPEYEDGEESLDARERFEETTAADHLRAVLKYAVTHWEKAWSATKKGDASTALMEHDTTRAALAAVNTAYALWFDCIGQLCEVSPESAGVAGELVSVGMEALRRATPTSLSE